jgi:hypothetical protein
VPSNSSEQVGRLKIIQASSLSTSTTCQFSSPDFDSPQAAFDFGLEISCTSPKDSFA